MMPPCDRVTLATYEHFYLSLPGEDPQGFDRDVMDILRCFIQPHGESLSGEPLVQDPGGLRDVQRGPVRTVPKEDLVHDGVRLVAYDALGHGARDVETGHRAIVLIAGLSQRVPSEQGSLSLQLVQRGGLVRGLHHLGGTLADHVAKTLELLSALMILTSSAGELCECVS